MKNGNIQQILFMIVWVKDYNFMTIDLTKNKFNGKYRKKNLDIIFLPHTNPFK